MKALAFSAVLFLSSFANAGGSYEWHEKSAEFRAASLQTYRLADRTLFERVKAEKLPRGSWGVISDLDETVLDNTPYQKSVADLPANSPELQSTSPTDFDAPKWREWVKAKTAQPLPGAKDFFVKVKEEGGIVAFVTNRIPEDCATTREQLDKLEIPYEVVLCKTKRGREFSSKNGRFKQIQEGDFGSRGKNPVNVLLWVGDNISDFPNLSQASKEKPADLAPFGTTYFMLPNPMYGSWQK